MDSQWAELNNKSRGAEPVLRRWSRLQLCSDWIWPHCTQPVTLHWIGFTSPGYRKFSPTDKQSVSQSSGGVSRQTESARLGLSVISTRMGWNHTWIWALSVDHLKHLRPHSEREVLDVSNTSGCRISFDPRLHSQLCVLLLEQAGAPNKQEWGKRFDGSVTRGGRC